MNRTTLRGALLSDWGPAIETTIRGIAAVAVACYCAGLAVGTWLHHASAWLARQWTARVVRSADPSTDPADVSMPLALLPAAAAPIALLMPARVPTGPAPVPPAVHPLAILADTLQAQPVAALRRKAGVRSKRHRKGALVAQLVAC
jgi:hypothetical protein